MNSFYFYAVLYKCLNLVIFPVIASIPTNINQIAQINKNIYIEDFNARGDGITDDTNAFQEALAFCEHKNLQLQNNKKYVISGTLELKEGCTIEGNNAIIINNNKKLKNENDNRQLFLITKSNNSLKNIIIHNTQINGSNDRNIPSNRACNISVGQSYNDNLIKNTLIYNIKISGGIINSSAIIIFGKTENTIIENCNIDGNFIAAFHSEWNSSKSGIMNPKDVSIINCKIINNQHSAPSYGFYVSGCINVNIINCIAENCINSYGIYNGDKGVKAPYHSLVNIYNSKSINHQCTGIEIRGGYNKNKYYDLHVLVDSCYIKGLHNQKTTGILIAERSKHITIQNSQINCNLFGIYCSRSTHINIFNNEFDNIYLNSLFGFNLYNSKIIDNKFINNPHPIKLKESENNIIR